MLTCNTNIINLYIEIKIIDYLTSTGLGLGVVHGALGLHSEDLGDIHCVKGRGLRASVLMVLVEMV